MPQTVTVSDIQKISVKDGETFVVFVDITNRPHTTAQKMLQEAATFMRKAIPNPNVQVIAVAAGTYQFGVVTHQVHGGAVPAQGLPGPVGQIMNGSPGGNDTDAFDRAMKGLS